MQWRASFVGNLASTRHNVCLIEFNANDVWLDNALLFQFFLLGDFYWLDLLKMFEIQKERFLFYPQN